MRDLAYPSTEFIIYYGCYRAAENVTSISTRGLKIGGVKVTSGGQLGLLYSLASEMRNRKMPLRYSPRRTNITPKNSRMLSMCGIMYTPPGACFMRCLYSIANLKSRRCCADASLLTTTSASIVFY